MLLITVVTRYSHRQWIDDKDSKDFCHVHSVRPSSGNQMKRAHFLFCARFLVAVSISRGRVTQNLEARPRNRNDPTAFGAFTGSIGARLATDSITKSINILNR